MESSGAIGIADVAAPNPATLELFAGEVREMLDGLGNELLRQIAIGDGKRTQKLFVIRKVDPKSGNGKFHWKFLDRQPFFEFTLHPQ